MTAHYLKDNVANDLNSPLKLKLVGEDFQSPVFLQCHRKLRAAKKAVRPLTNKHNWVCGYFILVIIMSTSIVAI